MEIGIREALILFGLIVIVGIFFDGYRRVRDNKRSHLGIKLDNISQDVKEEEIYNSELPTGKARIVGHDREVSAPLRASLLSESLDGDQPDNLSFSATGSTTPVQGEVDSLQGSPDIQAVAPNEHAASKNQPDYLAVRRKSAQAAVDRNVLQEGSVDKEASVEKESSVGIRKEYSAAEASSAELPSAESSVPSGQKELSEHGKEASSHSVVGPQKELIVIKIIAKKESVFYGEKLMQTLLALGLRYGDMKIFHRYERPEEKKGLLFSMANLVEPGSFDLDTMSSFTTPGVCLFLNLPGPKRSLYAFDLLIDTARKLVHNLGAEMRDENHSVMTPQTVEHYRQRVMEFERRQKMIQRSQQTTEMV